MSEDIRSEAGFLVLADISGFTAFVAGTELEHGALVTGVLLEAVMRRLSPPLEIQELEGDAVFAIGPDGALPDGSVLAALLTDVFAVFKEEQRQLARDVHHGRFVRQTVGGRSRVAGPDVILVHRLLKNPVGGSAYLLLTAPALERVGVDPVASGMQQHLVSYPHLGEVPCFVADLEPLARPDFAAAPVLAA